jgi:sortase family protein
VSSPVVSSPVAGTSAGGPYRTRPAARSSPVSLRIPALGLTASVGPLGLNPDGTVQVPKNPDQAGWYRLGPSPGQLGSAVILGHVDSKTGPAIFYRLSSLRAGNKIVVTLADGTVVRFQVDRVITYPNAEFPARKIYGSQGRPTLQLVTCGGRYDHHARSYTANVVVYTSLVSIRGTKHERISG